MGVNAFSKPSPILNYKPIPFKEIAFTGDKLRAASDSAMTGASAIQSAQADVMAVDEKYKNEVLNDYDTKAQEITDMAKSDPYGAKMKATQLGTDFNKELTRGRLAGQIADRKKSDANLAKIDKLYMEGNLSKEDADSIKRLAISRYKGSGDLNEFGSYNRYQDYNPAFLETSIPDQAIKVVKDWEPNTWVGDLKKTKNGYLTRKGVEIVDEREVLPYVTSYLKQIDNNKSYVNQQADLALMGQDLTNGVQLADRSMSEEAWREDYINSIYDDAARVATAKGAYTKESFTDKVDWQKKEYMKQAAKKRELEAAKPKIKRDTHIDVGSGKVVEADVVPEDIFNAEYEADGSIKKSEVSVPKLQINKTSGIIQKGELARYEKALAEAKKEVEDEQRRNTDAVYARAEEYEMNLYSGKDEFGNKILRTPQDLNEELRKAFINIATEGQTLRLIENKDVAVNEGRKLADNLESLQVTVVNPKDFKEPKKKQSFEEVATIGGNHWLNGADTSEQNEFRNELKEVLTTSGIAGTTPMGKPYVNYNGMAYIIEPTNEVKLYTSTYSKMLKFRGGQEENSYTNDKGYVFKYYPDVINGEFTKNVEVYDPNKDEVKVVDMEWLSKQSEETLESKNLLKSFKNSKAANGLSE